MFHKIGKISDRGRREGFDLFGGSSSSSTTEINTSTATKILSEAIMSCRGNTTVSQNVDISGDGNVLDGVSFVQATKISSDCSQDMKRDSNLQQQVATDLQQKIEAQGSGIMSMLGGSSADVNSKINTDVSTLFSDSTLTEIINGVNAAQGLSVSGNNNIIRNYTQKQTTDLLSKGLQKALNNLSTVQSANMAMAQEAIAITTNPVSEIIDSTFSGLAGIMKYWVILMLGAAAIAAFFFREQVKTAFCSVTPFCDGDEDEGQPHSKREGAGESDE